MRRYATTDPAIPAIRLTGLLGAADPALATEDAANRALPVNAMHKILDMAEL